MKFLNWILDLIYPPKCVLCRKILNTRTKQICSKCEKALPITKNGGVKKGNFFTACVSPLYYENKVREALLRYKFHNMTVYANYFGSLLAGHIEEYIDSHVDIISWVPLSKKRFRNRGYDQAQLLAEVVGEQLNIPYVQVLKKTRHTAPQSRTGSAEKRKSNVSGAYSIIDPKLVAGKRILLIDDIVTTGSTFSECARILGLSGADKIYCAAVARKREE